MKQVKVFLTHVYESVLCKAFPNNFFNHSVRWIKKFHILSPNDLIWKVSLSKLDNGQCTLKQQEESFCGECTRIFQILRITVANALIIYHTTFYR